MSKVVRLKDQTRSLFDPRSGWGISLKQEKELPNELSAKINSWLKFGALVVVGDSSAALTQQNRSTKSASLITDKDVPRKQELRKPKKSTRKKSKRKK